MGLLKVPVLVVVGVCIIALHYAVHACKSGIYSKVPGTSFKIDNINFIGDSTIGKSFEEMIKLCYLEPTCTGVSHIVENDMSALLSSVYHAMVLAEESRMFVSFDDEIEMTQPCVAWQREEQVDRMPGYNWPGTVSFLLYYMTTRLSTRKVPIA